MQASMPRVKLGPANLAETEMRGYVVENQNILVANVGGRYKALDDCCNHAGCLLSGGHIEGNLVVCPCHEVGFDLDSGENVTSPYMCHGQSRAQVTVENGELFLDELPG